VVVAGVVASGVEATRAKPAGVVAASSGEAATMISAEAAAVETSAPEAAETSGEEIARRHGQGEQQGK
jgi:hypothetical protein